MDSPKEKSENPVGEGDIVGIVDMAVVEEIGEEKRSPVLEG